MASVSINTIQIIFFNNCVNSIRSDRQRWGQLKYGCVRVFYNKPHDGLNVSDSEDSITDNDDEDKQ